MIKKIIFASIFALGVAGCSSGNPATNGEAESVGVQADSVEMVGDANVAIVKDSIVDFMGIPIHLDEAKAVRELEEAGVLKVEDLCVKDGKFVGAVVEFAGVKFGMNRNFVFLTSRHDKAAVKSLVRRISKYYGEPEVDYHEVPVSNYYHWNLHGKDHNAPYIRIRPLHTKDGGLTMMWEW